jgi:uncharacterized repeat protein (TIGR03837 family)
LTVDILCKVVDNYGDIGVAYRLAKALSALRPALRLRLVVDRLDVFAALWPAVRPDLPVQDLAGPGGGRWTILDWNRPWGGLRDAPPRLVIEAFTCGRPDWYDAVLHDPADPAPRLHLILEYLTAESWADDFHLLPSLSPIPQVSKRYFMPGFSPRTGGLIHDAGFMAAKARWDNVLQALDGAAGQPGATDGGPALTAAATARETAIRAVGAEMPAGSGAAFWLCLFSYEHDYRALVADLTHHQAGTGRQVLVLAAAGRSQPGFRADWEAAGRPFGVVWLPFLGQEAWDEVLLACDCAIIRGEESLARAALGGRPFVWHAYLQDDGYQRVKAAALADALAPDIEATGGIAATAAWRNLMASFNERAVDSVERPAADPWLPFLGALPALSSGFRRIAEKLEMQGDCAAKVLSLMDDFG